MGHITRRMQVDLSEIADAALDTVDIKDGAVENAKLAASGLDIAKCTVGTAGAARIPSLPTSRITTGTFGLARIPSITPAKLDELFEHGTVAAVTATGIYLTFDTAFSAPPTVVVTGIDAAARLAQAPAAGSAKLELSAAGTAVVHYTAWGAR